MANLTEVDFEHKLFCPTFKIPSLISLELMENFFGHVSINPVYIELPIVKENWRRLKTLSDDNFSVNTPLVPYILPCVDVKRTKVLKSFCGYLNST